MSGADPPTHREVRGAPHGKERPENQNHQLDTKKERTSQICSHHQCLKLRLTLVNTNLNSRVDINQRS